VAPLELSTVNNKILAVFFIGIYTAIINDFYTISAINIAVVYIAFIYKFKLLNYY